MHDLKSILSAKRLESYAVQTSRYSGFSTIELYNWNTCLSESLYPALQTIEVSLRNSIHHAIVYHFKDEYWLTNGSILDLPESHSVEKEINHLEKKRKNVTIDRLIAELTFGFWTSLLDTRYEKILWPKIIKTVFANIPAHLRTRKNISRRFNKIRRLRNRIFHYEPIWHWADLDEQHSEILETIAWINSEGLILLPPHVDRFKHVFKVGPIKLGSLEHCEVV
jgi:hypothetical protein